jgi:hypothetical protein
VLEINTPLNGSSYTWMDELPGEARAYDPDNVDPDTCQPSGSFTANNGDGITKVEFRIEYVDGGGVTVHQQDQLSFRYCAFTGTPTCLTHDLGLLEWPNDTTINSGLHKLWARAWDDEGVHSEWVYVEFTLDVDPTPTPTPTPSDTPTPTATIDPCTQITLTGFVASGTDVTLELINGSPAMITIDQIDLSWTDSPNLKEILVGSNKIWDGDQGTPVNLSSADWIGSPSYRQIAAGASASPLKFVFWNSADTSGYSLTVRFDNSCSKSFNN